MVVQELFRRIQELQQKVASYDPSMIVDGEVSPTRWECVISCLKEIACLLAESKGATP